MPALNSSERVIQFSVFVPPPLQPYTPTRSASTHGCCLSHLTPATRSLVSETDGLSTSMFSSFLLIAGRRPVVDHRHHVAILAPGCCSTIHAVIANRRSPTAPKAHRRCAESPDTSCLDRSSRLQDLRRHGKSVRRGNRQQLGKMHACRQQLRTRRRQHRDSLPSDACRVSAGRRLDVGKVVEVVARVRRHRDSMRFPCSSRDLRQAGAIEIGAIQLPLRGRIFQRVK